MPQVRYAVTYAHKEVTDAEFRLVRRLFRDDQAGNKVTAIKFIREHYCPGLKEAKDICEAIAVMPAIQVPF